MGRSFASLVLLPQGAWESFLRRAPRPFRPTPAADMQQVRAKAYKEVRGDFEYLFEPAKPAFEPIFDRTQQIGAHGELAERWESEIDHSSWS